VFGALRDRSGNKKRGLILALKWRNGKEKNRKEKKGDEMKKNQFYFFCNISFPFPRLKGRFQADITVHLLLVLDFFLG